MTSLKFAIVVYGAPYSSEGCLSALQFAEAVIAEGHDILRVFFYHDGVYTANSLTNPPQDEPDIGTLWQEFGLEYDLDMVVCIASCLRRGIIDAKEATRHEKSSANLRPGFTISGLGQLVEASLNADRVVTFGH